jgi:hypothetical protein
MKTNPVFDEPLLPSLFRLTDRANGMANKGRSFADMMLDPKRLEAILKAFGKKKKPAPRRMG